MCEKDFPCVGEGLSTILWLSEYQKDHKIMYSYQQVINQVDVEYLESKLSDIVPGVTRGYCHSESSVRKASVFCLVAIHAVVGDKMREHLVKLSSSQVILANCQVM